MNELQFNEFNSKYNWYMFQNYDHVDEVIKYVVGYRPKKQSEVSKFAVSVDLQRCFDKIWQSIN
ncbi:MAG: hypothetical protein ACOYMA_12260 [Bacteroidia bacterium]